MHIGIRALVAAGAVSLLAMGPAAVASATSPGRPGAAPSTVTPASPAEVKGFIQLRGFPRGVLIKGGMGTYSEKCSRGNNGRPFEFRDEALLDVTVTHSIFNLFDPVCARGGPRSEWELVIVSPDGVKGRVTFALGWNGSSKYLLCGGGGGGIYGDIRCVGDRSFDPDPRIIVEPR
jgi:hypothetical protein